MVNMKQKEYEELLKRVIEIETYLIDKIEDEFSELKDMLLTYTIEE
jgi:hypothetical protein